MEEIASVIGVYVLIVLAISFELCGKKENSRELFWQIIRGTNDLDND